MTTAEERKKILGMVAEKIITPEDGVKLLNALKTGEKSKKSTGPGTYVNIPRMNPTAGMLRILVTNPATSRVKTDVHVPLALINVGLGIGARFVPGLEDFDVDSIIDMIKSGAKGKLVEVMNEEEGEYVEIFVD